MSIWAVLGIIFTVWCAFRLYNEIGKSFAIPELLVLIMALQWIIGPWISYNLSLQHYKYYMRVSEATYMEYVVPATMLFAYFLLRRTSTNKLIFTIEVFHYFRLARYLVVLGFIADAIINIVPTELRFFVFLISNLKLVGSGILLFSEKNYDRWYIVATIIILLSKSLVLGMFHDLILWLAFLFLIWAIKHQLKPVQKIIIILSVFSLISLLQLSKRFYRQSENSGFISLLENSGTGLSHFSNNREESLLELNTRLNQGWIVAAVLDNVPVNQDYAHGSTVVEAVAASLLPRIIYKNKAVAGGKKNFEKYTGLELGKYTSMSISVVGEAYANFGRLGGIGFMALWGWFLSGAWVLLVRASRSYIIWGFFASYIFLQVIKAEIDLVVILNHLIKSSALAWLVIKFQRLLI